MLFFKAVHARDVAPGDRIRHQGGLYTVEDSIYAGPEFGSYIYLTNGLIAHFSADGDVDVVDESLTKTILDRYN